MKRDAYIKWIRDYENELHVQMLSGDFVFDLQYQPEEYVLLQRGVTTDTNTENKNNLQYYTLTIKSDNGIDLVRYGVASMEEQQQKQYYLSYLFQDDITLEQGDRVLPCVLYHFERAADNKGGRTFMLGFENPDKDAEEVWLVIRSEWFGSLPVKIKIAKSDIPQLEL